MPEPKEKPNRIIFLALLGFIILLILPPLYFLYKTTNFTISNSQTDWVNFGSFSWSYVSSISTAIYAGFFVYLAYSLNKITEKVAHLSIDFQKGLSMFNFKIQLIHSIKKDLDRLSYEDFSNIHRTEILRIGKELNNFINSYGVIFKFGEQTIIDNLLESIKQMVEIKNHDNQLSPTEKLEYNEAKQKFLETLFSNVLSDKLIIP